MSPSRRNTTYEIAGIVLLAMGLFLAAALLSLQLGSGDLMGPLGRVCARTLYAAFGIGAHVVTALMIAVPVRLLAGRRVVRTVGEGVGLGLGLLSAVVLLHLVGRHYRIGGYGAGGVVGELLAEVLRAAVSTAGTALVASMGLALALVVTTGMRMAAIGAWLRALVARVWAMVAWAAGEAGKFVMEVARAILPEADTDAEAESETE